jgi:hypothetical protein
MTVFSLIGVARESTPEPRSTRNDGGDDEGGEEEEER